MQVPKQDSRLILPSKDRGLVLSGTSVRLMEDGKWRVGKRIDAEQLRFALVFWDRIVWPGHHFAPAHHDAEEEAAIHYLESEGVLVVPTYPVAQNMTPSQGLLVKTDFVYSDLATDSLISHVKALGGPLSGLVDQIDLPRPVSGIAIRQLLAFMQADAAHQGARSIGNDV